MRILTTLTLGVCLAVSALAQSKVSSADREAQIYNGPRVATSMYIWSDKYTYTAGQNLSLKWTVKTNNDLYPYTMFVYRQNNQTGVKTYYPAGNTTVTDFTGNTLAQGFQATRLTDKSKATLLTAEMPNELGMHTFVVELRDYTGTRPLKTAYMKVGAVSGTQTLTGDITSSRTLTNDTLWQISGLTTVKNGAVLTVQPGTFVVGLPGSQPASVLLISREGRLEAAGTEARPIVFTSSRPFGQRQRGDWGGVLMLGKAPVNTGANIAGGATCGTGVTCNNPAGSFYIEGLTTNPDGLYGGTDPAHSCGTMTYVRIEYSGVTLSPNNETNSFTWAGCGTGTTAHHLQAIFGGDDSFEWFGGTMNTKYVIGGMSADDYADFQLGTTGKLQFGMFYQSPDARGNRGIEGDNSEYNAAATPFSDPTFYNLTFFGSGQVAFDEPGASPGIFLRRGARGTFNNIVVSNFADPCINISDASTQAQADLGNVKMDGILCWKNNRSATNSPNTLAGEISNAYTLEFANGNKGNGAGKNFVVGDPLIQRPFEYSDPDWFSLFSSPVYRTGWVNAPDDGFFEQVRFIGAFGDTDWTQGWTSYLVDADIQ
ncbi:MAG: hypothetical protein ABIR70_23000 [Bryobacteraceae bacterium]